MLETQKKQKIGDNKGHKAEVTHGPCSGQEEEKTKPAINRTDPKNLKYVFYLNCGKTKTIGVISSTNIVMLNDKCYLHFYLYCQSTFKANNTHTRQKFQ